MTLFSTIKTPVCKSVKFMSKRTDGNDINIYHPMVFNNFVHSVSNTKLGSLTPLKTSLYRILSISCLSQADCQLLSFFYNVLMLIAHQLITKAVKRFLLSFVKPQVTSLPKSAIYCPHVVITTDSSQHFHHGTHSPAIPVHP